VAAVGNMKNLLANGGYIWYTIPLNYNAVAEEYLRKMSSSVKYYHRVSYLRWESSDLTSASKEKYDQRWSGATGIQVGVIPK